MERPVYFLQSEVARLVLGYLKESSHPLTYKSFLKECKYLAEYAAMLKEGIEYPTAIMGISLCQMLNEYAELKLKAQETGMYAIDMAAAWKQFDAVTRLIKKKTKTQALKTASYQQGRRTQHRVDKAPCRKDTGDVESTHDLNRVSVSLKKIHLCPSSSGVSVGSYISEMTPGGDNVATVTKPNTDKPGTKKRTAKRRTPVQKRVSRMRRTTRSSATLESVINTQGISDSDSDAVDNVVDVSGSMDMSENIDVPGNMDVSGSIDVTRNMDESGSGLLINSQTSGVMQQSTSDPKDILNIGMFQNSSSRSDALLNKSTNLHRSVAVHNEGMKEKVNDEEDVVELEVDQLPDLEQVQQTDQHADSFSHNMAEESPVKMSVVNQCQTTPLKTLSICSETCDVIGRSPRRRKHQPKRRNDNQSLRPTDKDGGVAPSEQRDSSGSESSKEQPNLQADPFPMLLEKIMNDTKLHERLAETINKSRFAEPPQASCRKPVSTSTIVDDFFGSPVPQHLSEDTIDGIIHMAKSDPLFDSLINIFETEGNKVPGTTAGAHGETSTMSEHIGDPDGCMVELSQDGFTAAESQPATSHPSSALVPSSSSSPPHTNSQDIPSTPGPAPSPCPSISASPCASLTSPCPSVCSMTSGTGSPGQVPLKKKRRIKPIPCKPVTSALPVFSSPVMHPLSPAQTPEACSPAPSTHLQQVSSPCIPPAPHGQSGLMSPPLSVSAHRSRTPAHVPQQSPSACVESRGMGMSSSPPQSSSMGQSPGTQIAPSQDVQHYQPSETPFESPQYQTDPSHMSLQGIHHSTPAPCVDPITSRPNSHPCVATSAHTTVLQTSFQTSQPLHQNGPVSQTPSLDPTVSSVKMQSQAVVLSSQQVTSFPGNGVQINIAENGVIKTYSMDETNGGLQLLPTNSLPNVSVINSSPPVVVPSPVMANTSCCPRPVTVNPPVSTSVLTKTTSGNILNSIASCPSAVYVTQPVVTPSSVVGTNSPTSHPQSSEISLVSSVLVSQSSTVNHQSSCVQHQSSVPLVMSSGSVQPQSSKAPLVSSVIIPMSSEALSHSLSVPALSTSAYSPSTMEDSLHTVTALPGSIQAVRQHSPSPALTVSEPCPSSQGSLPTAISSALLCTNSQMSFDLLGENTLSDFVLPVKPAEDQVETVVLTDTNISLPNVVVNDQIYDMTMSPNGKQLILKNPRPINDSQTSSYQPVTVVPSSIPQIRPKMTPVKAGSQNSVMVSPKLPATSPRLSKLQQIVKQSISPKFKTSCKPNILSRSPRQTKTVTLPSDGYFVSPNQEKTVTVLNTSEITADDQYIAIPLGRIVEENHKRSLSFDKRPPTDGVSNGKAEPPKSKPLSKSLPYKRPIKSKIRMGDRKPYPKVNGASVMNVEIGYPTGKSSCVMSLISGDKEAHHKLKPKKKVINTKPDKEQMSLTEGNADGSAAVKQPPRSKANNLPQTNKEGSNGTSSPPGVNLPVRVFENKQLEGSRGESPTRFQKFVPLTQTSSPSVQISSLSQSPGFSAKGTITTTVGGRRYNCSDKQSVVREMNGPCGLFSSEDSNLSSASSIMTAASDPGPLRGGMLKMSSRRREVVARTLSIIPECNLQGKMKGSRKRSGSNVSLDNLSGSARKKQKQPNLSKLNVDDFLAKIHRQ
ncbi:uncharacterized protein [Haliotis asinina]|uniref:uncharacterized protein n=1 Tax=Haliotis asinina TaxID=109174 RepID=UPI0035326FA4